jgi:hypothetical protein
VEAALNEAIKCREIRFWVKDCINWYSKFKRKYGALTFRLPCGGYQQIATTWRKEY